MKRVKNVDKLCTSIEFQVIHKPSTEYPRLPPGSYSRNLLFYMHY